MLITLMLGFSLVSIYFKPYDKDLISLFGLLFPFIYILALIVLPFGFRKKRLTFFIGVLLLAIGLPRMFSFARIDIQKKDPASDITVMSFNAMMGYGLVNDEHEVAPQRLEELKSILAQTPVPDVLCLQEAGPLAMKTLSLLSDYPHRHRIKPKGAVVFSKHPIVEKGIVEFGSKINSCLWADIVLPTEEVVRVYSTHLESTRLNSSSYELLSEDEGSGHAPFSGIKDLVIKYPRYAGKRADQAARVKQHIKRSKHPVILCGDMNEPPTSYTYRILKKGMTDAFRENGHGFGNTWKGKIPMLRIDYIFASRELSNTSYACIRSDLSDHYPVKASYTLNHKD